MKKKSILLLLVISLLVNGLHTTKIFAAEIPLSMKTAYDEIMAQRPDWALPIEAFDIDVWNDYDVLVMDIPGTFPPNLSTLKEPDGSANDYNSDADEYRYIGKNPDGYLVNNPKYPDDHSGSAVINTYDWQKNTDEKTAINQYISSAEDKAFYENEIFYFLEKEYGSRFDDTEDPSSWLSNAIVILPVSSTGDGVIKYMHKWDSNHDGIKENWYITVNLRAKDEVITDEGTTTETSISTGTSGAASLGDTRIAADVRDTESFDVTKGIPTSEDLYANVIASEYVHNENYRNVNGTITYKVTVSKTYTLYKWDSTDKHVDTDGDGINDDWEGGWDSKTETVTNTYDVIRNYSFHMIDSLSVYSLSSALLNNAALPSGTVTLNSSVVAPTVSMTRDTTVENHYQTPISGTTYNLTLPGEDVGKSKSNTSYDSVPNEDFNSDAEGAIGEIKVKNDQLVFNGTTLMDGGWYEGTAPTPLAIPDAPLNDSNDLYRADLTIPNTVTNGVKTSTGTLTYNVVANTGSETTYTVPIASINSVVIHTPVVCYSTITEDLNYIQAIDKNTTVQNLVLNRAFDIHYPNSGQHITALGYGNKDYEKYMSQKQLKLDFDVYLGADRTGIFIPANTWHNLDKTLEDYTFFIPHWVSEGSGEVLFRVIPINDIGNSSLYEFNANKNISNYRAVNSIDVDLIGQIYDFNITGTTEKDYSNMFFNTDGSNTGTTYYVGNENNYGISDSSHINTLPIMPGKNTVTGFDKKVLKKGSAFFYSVKTVGDMQGEKDYVVLLPKFYYVDYSGNHRQEIDIWYEDNGLKKMDNYRFDIKASLNNKYSNVKDININNTSNYYFDDYYSGSRTKANYQTWFLNDDSKTSKKIGSSDLIALDYEQRLYIGNANTLPASVNGKSAMKGTQSYHGAYFIPNSARALPKGDNDIKNELKNGYIIVNFEIYTIRNFSGNTTDYHLSYNDSVTANMFSIENFDTTQGVFTLQYGDVAFYDTNKSTDTDYIIQGIY